jgi:anaerobic selenocysteine-containing dehydrogenase
VQWPCDAARPDGTERLYTDGTFNTDPDHCESYGHDLRTGAEVEEQEYRAKEPGGRAFLHALEYEEAPETTSEEYPYLVTTGRTVYHFHTRTKTARAPQLQAAAPDVWVEINPDDARELDIREGDLVELRSARGRMQGRARVCGIRRGVVFVPFHYGEWDRSATLPDGVDGASGGARPSRAANELTVHDWDPVSKQPHYKVAAVVITKIAAGDGTPSPAPTIGGPAPISPTVAPTVGGPAADADSVIGAGPAS